MSQHPRNNEDNTNQQKSTPGQRSNPQVNRGTSHIFYKTRMCQRFLDGTCRNGDACTFAHGENDMRDPPPNWQELVKDNSRGGNGIRNWNDDQKIIQRMRICHRFYNGDDCPYGDKCSFIHETPDKFREEAAAMDMDRARESSAIKIETVVARSQSQTEIVPNVVTIVNTDPDASRASFKGVYWKTRICSKWETTGQCMYGDKCHYAHGYGELHAPVGRVEGEGHASGNSYAGGPVTTNVVAPVIEPATADPVPQVRGRGFLKLAGKKLKGIYADWIDDDDESS